jgi:hypothetical protein
MKVDRIYSAGELTSARWPLHGNRRHRSGVVKSTPVLDRAGSKGLSRPGGGTNGNLQGAVSLETFHNHHFTFLALKRQTTTKIWIAILACLGMMAACVIISVLIDFDLAWLMMLGTALWAAQDSSKIGFRRYKSGIACGTVVLFFACALFWLVVFPWYLAVRCKIKAGTAVLNDEGDKGDEGCN